MSSHLRSYCCLALALTLIACGIIPPVPREILPGPEITQPPGYQIIFIIHGDGDYLYHDTNGVEYRADEVTLESAKKVAEGNSRAEVFIFHEKHRRHSLLFFPRRDGVFYYYRNGKLLAEESYWRDKGKSRFEPEVERFNRFRAQLPSQPVKLFLYFGHEIPETGGRGYDASYRKKVFNVSGFVDGIRRFTGDSTKFDLVVLSSCFNGTPYTISALSPYARYIVASPGNLHLSYFDLKPLESLDIGFRDKDMPALARKFAQQSLDRLTKDIQTEITIAVYDVDQVQNYLKSVGSSYIDVLAAAGQRQPMSIEYCDCAEDSIFARESMGKGVEVYYRSARFGRSKNKQGHSGWECPKLTN